VTSTEFVLIRHAESTWNAALRWQGHGNPPLSARGRAQARACAEGLRGQQADVLVCSDLLRTRETAAPIAGVLGLEPIRCERLRELDVGAWTGLTREEIAEKEPEVLRPFESGDPDVRPGGGETRGEIRVRVRTTVEKLAARYPGSRIILVVHSGVIKALLPGSEPANTDVVETTLQEIRAARPNGLDAVTAPL
jgi:broad specificity phosphatase PhoE